MIQRVMEPVADTVPVLVVGAGPVGLGVAAELGWRGIGCMVVERSGSTARVPRTNAINVRTMEFCRRWGVAAKVRAAAIPEDFPHTLLYVTGMNGYEIARIDRPTHGGKAASPTSPERAQRCNQLWFDPILQGLADGLPSVQMRYECQFESFEQIEDGVRVKLTDLRSGEPKVVTASYLVGCDGGRSALRDLLGVRMDGISILDYPVDIYFRSERLWERHDKGKAAITYLVGPEGVWANLEALNGVDYWRLTLHGSKEPPDLATIDAPAALRRALGDGVPCEVLAVTPWVRRAVVANTYGHSRVFIAGDCAHQNPPDGGFGMNTGMGDAVDLGWKIAAMLQGWGGERLLGSYEAERRPVAQRNVAAAMKRIERRTLSPDAFVCDDGPAGHRSRESVRAVIDAMASLFSADNVALGYRYDDSPVVVPDDMPLPRNDTEAPFVPSAAPGSRAPHVWVEEGKSLLDSFGRGFVLLRLGPDRVDSAALSAAARERRVPLEELDIESPEVLALYQRRLVLVRPDGHVAWRGDALPQDCLALIDRVRGA